MQVTNCLLFLRRMTRPEKEQLTVERRVHPAHALGRSTRPCGGQPLKESIMKKSTCLAGALALGLILPAAGFGASAAFGAGDT